MHKKLEISCLALESLPTVLAMVFGSDFNAKFFGVFRSPVFVECLFDVSLIITEVALVAVHCAVPFFVAVTEKVRKELTIHWIVENVLY